MKQWIAGIFGAILGGFLLFFAQGQYEKYSKSQESIVTVIADDKAFSIDSELSKKIYASINDRSSTSSVNIYTFKIRNDGTQDLANKSFTAPIDDVVSFGSLSSPNDNDKNVRIYNDSKSVTVNYRLLPSGKYHSFWIATKYPVSSLQNFSADNPGISVTNGPVDGDGFPWGFFAYVGVSIVSLIIGGVIAQSSLSSELKARGIDLEATLKTPKL